MPRGAGFFAVGGFEGPPVEFRPCKAQNPQAEACATGYFQLSMALR
jgi:hypothetical protein